MNENIKVPEGWKVVRLGEVAERITNGFVYGFSDIKKDGIPITRIETISEGYIDKNKLGYISEELYPYIKKYHLKTGDILFSHINSLEHVGKTAIYNNIPPFLVHGMNLLLLRFKNSMCYPFFLIYLLKKENIRNEIKNLSGQAVNQVSIKPFELSNLNIPLPSLPEQRKIAEILETIDNAIEKTDAIIEKYNRIKQGLMQDLLTKGIDENWHIRDEKTHKFKDSPLGRIPEEWEVVRLGEIFNIKAGGDIDELSYSDTRDKRFQYSIFSNTLENKGLYGYSDKFTYPENCITITGRGTLGHAIPRFEKFNAIIRVLVLIPKFEMNIVFISEYINNRISFVIESTGVPQLTAPKVAEYYIPLPSLAEQQRIAEILLQIDEVIEKEQAYKEKLEGIKKGLMEDLLTGKVRVNHLIEEESIDEIG